MIFFLPSRGRNPNVEKNIFTIVKHRFPSQQRLFARELDREGTCAFCTNSFPLPLIFFPFTEVEFRSVCRSMVDGITSYRPIETRLRRKSDGRSSPFHLIFLENSIVGKVEVFCTFCLKNISITILIVIH